MKTIRIDIFDFDIRPHQIATVNTSLPNTTLAMPKYRSNCIKTVSRKRLEFRRGGIKLRLREINFISLEKRVE